MKVLFNLSGIYFNRLFQVGDGINDQGNQQYDDCDQEKAKRNQQVA